MKYMQASAQEFWVKQYTDGSKFERGSGQIGAEEKWWMRT